MTTLAPAIVAKSGGAAITGFTTVWGVTINPSVIFLSIIILGTIALVCWAHLRNQFNVFDLIADRMPDGTRRASGIKTAYMAAFLASTWVVIDQEIKLKLTEGIFGLYLATWCASLIAKVVFDKKDAPSFPPIGGQTVTASATVESK
jgi:hypothetical protein